MKHDATFTNSIGMDFVLIPAGTFWMGSADDDKAGDDIENDFFFDREVPRHEVTISRPFYSGQVSGDASAVAGGNGQ